MMIFVYPLVALLAVNALTVVAFAHDKACARRGDWRVSEATLLGLALAGGSLGAVWARHRFRHKTRKQPFATWLDVIAMLHAGIVIGIVGVVLV